MSTPQFTSFVFSQENNSKRVILSISLKAERPEWEEGILLGKAAKQREFICFKYSPATFTHYLFF